MADRLTAMDVQKQEFRKVLRGCDPEEVRLYLRSVAEELERLNLDNGRLREKFGHLEAERNEIRGREQTLQQTLVTAQKMAEELKQRAQSEADLLLKEARMKAERQLLESQDQLARLEAQISRATLERDLFDKRLRATIEEHLDLLEHRNRGRAPAQGDEAAEQTDQTVQAGLGNVHPMRRLGNEAG